MQDTLWHKEYEIGVEDIDLQHHYFFNLINRIETEIAGTDDRRYIESLVSSSMHTPAFTLSVKRA